MALLEEAVALATELHGEGSEQSPDSRATLARAHQLAGHPAATLGGVPADLLRRKGASGRGSLAAVLRWGRSLAVLRGEYAEADRQLRGALTIQRRSDAAKVAELRADLGLLLAGVGRREEAIPLLRRAVAVLERKLSAEHPTRRRAREALDEAVKPETDGTHGRVKPPDRARRPPRAPSAQGRPPGGTLEPAWTWSSKGR